MERSVADIFERWLTPRAPEACNTCAVGGCGPRLGTGNDASVARALRELGADVPHDYDAYLRNVRDLYRVAEADIAIAVARSAHHEGTLVRRRDAVDVHFRSPEGANAGELSIRYELAELDPEGVGEPHTWVLSAPMPKELKEALTRLAPAWVRVQHRDAGGGVRALRAAQRKKPPRQWARRLPALQLPPHSMGFGT